MVKSTHRAKTLKLKKKKPVKTGRPPAPGERKAIRKRIVLSNTNALEVPTMVDMKAELDAAQIGVVLGLKGPLVDQLRAVEAFKTTQGWGLFRRPAILIREESVEIAKRLHAARDEKNTSVTIIDGERGAGKSLMLLQAMATAFLKGWIVVNIPEGRYSCSSRRSLVDTMSLQHKN
jgi:small subunit ribosomal protein S29